MKYIVVLLSRHRRECRKRYLFGSLKFILKHATVTCSIFLEIYFTEIASLVPVSDMYIAWGSPYNVVS